MEKVKVTRPTSHRTVTKNLMDTQKRSRRRLLAPLGQNIPSDDPRQRHDPSLEAREARRYYGSPKLGGSFSQLITFEDRGGRITRKVPKLGITMKVIPQKCLEVNAMSARCNKKPLMNLLATPLDRSTQERLGSVVSETTTIVAQKIGGKQHP